MGRSERPRAATATGACLAALPDDEWSLEPSLDEILAEPIVQILMQRDRTASADLRRLAARVRQRLGAEPQGVGRIG